MNISSTFRIIHVITTRKRSLGKGNIFTPVCHSVHRGVVVVSQHALQMVCLAAGGGVLSCSRGVPGRGGLLPWGIPGAEGVCSQGWGAPWMATAAGGTHPTGMLSCLAMFLL